MVKRAVSTPDLEVALEEILRQQRMNRPMREDKGAIDQAIQDVRARYPFPEIFEDTVDTVRRLAALLKRLEPSGGRLLDIGCGALDKTTVFQQMGFQCFGCDDFQDPWHNRPENLGPVLTFAQQAGVQVHVQRDGYSVPWEAASFDVATMINVIEHLHESPREILNFAGTCLKPGGLLVVGMPNSVNLRKRMSVVLGRSNYTPVRGFYEYVGSWRGHVREFTPRETREIVQWTGFEVVHQSTFHGMLKNRLPNQLLRLLFRGVCVPFPGYRDSLLVAARKPVEWVPRLPDSSAMQASLRQAIDG